MVPPNLSIHPARMTLAEIETLWGGDADPPLPECTYDPELHTGPDLAVETSAERAAREAVAREVCATCPARALCDRYALDARPSFGIWAGRTAAEIDTHAQISELYEAMRARAADPAGVEVA
ncbi:WhiB family transcriptional regulator [Nonomuraea fuscirosea]|uniref:WhiB family transcriptional regulator n=1 Tax=Nonomuraea fuscirosea TaxID=1291556 RepID=UPI002DD95162|nr:WhiB family transcriptional regulator [Nonomuraea fuscirosea]WSA48292.1 WhiB family transcriptional regulator [Nonomuraea fuscirosea]